MPTTLTLAIKASLFLPVQAVKQPPTAPPQSMRSTLASLRLVRDAALARTASWVVPFEGATLARGA